MLRSKFATGISTCAALAAFALTSACGDDDDGDNDTPNGGVAGRPAAGAGGTSAGSGGSSGGASAGRAGAPAGGSDAGGAGGASGDETARVRVLHLAPDAPDVDVFVNDGEDPVVQELGFPDGTDYLEVPAGTYDFDVAASGGTADDAVLSIDDLALDSGASYTAVAFDELDSIQALALVDDYEGLEEGDIRVRAVHVATGVGEVDIWNITDPGAPAPLYEDVDFGAAGDSIDVPAGAYSVGIDVDDDAVPDLAFDLPEIPAGTLVNLFAVADDADVFLLAQLPDGSTVRIDARGPTAFLRVLHLSPDAPEVDVFVDDGASPLVSELAFPEGTPYLAVEAGTYDVDVAPSGTSADDSVLAVDGLALAADTYYTAVAINEVAALTALPLVDDYTELAAGNIRIRAIHAAPGVGEVDIWNIPETGAPAPLWTDVDFGAAGGALDVAAGAYTIGIDVDDDATPDLTFTLPELAAGSFVNVFATRDDSDDVFLLAQLRDGSTVRVDAD